MDPIPIKYIPRSTEGIKTPKHNPKDSIIKPDASSVQNTPNIPSPQVRPTPIEPHPNTKSPAGNSLKRKMDEVETFHAEITSLKQQLDTANQRAQDAGTESRRYDSQLQTQQCLQRENEREPRLAIVRNEKKHKHEQAMMETRILVQNGRARYLEGQVTKLEEQKDAAKKQIKALEMESKDQKEVDTLKDQLMKADLAMKEAVEKVEAMETAQKEACKRMEALEMERAKFEEQLGWAKAAKDKVIELFKVSETEKKALSEDLAREQGKLRIIAATMAK